MKLLTCRDLWAMDVLPGVVGHDPLAQDPDDSNSCDCARRKPGQGGAEYDDPRGCERLTAHVIDGVRIVLCCGCEACVTEKDLLEVVRDSGSLTPAVECPAAGAFYNEINPYAACWLRELVATDQIANGRVDERSIVDVLGGDLVEYRQCHFFAGIGGWSFALRLAGWGDLECWTGSCPCQPLSVAGKQQGHTDERHLWPAFYRLIAECRPPMVFGEQVASKVGCEWLGGVHADLEGLGYAFGAADLPAASVGAPHQRQRLFWGAYLHGSFPVGKHLAGRTDQTVAERAAAQGFQIRDRRFSELVAMDVAQRADSYSQARGVVDGIPGGVDQLRAIGNAIVPQIAAEFIAAFVEAITDPSSPAAAVSAPATRRSTAAEMPQELPGQRREGTTRTLHYRMGTALLDGGAVPLFRGGQ